MNLKTDIAPADLATAIVREASRFVGLREVKPNAAWDNPTTPGPDAALSQELRELMRPSPWEPGWAYCAAFCEGVVGRALRSLGADDVQLKRWHAVMTPHCVTSARQFTERGLLSSNPCAGAVWLAKHGSASNGHAGIVTGMQLPHISTIEANTSLDSRNAARDREGDWITTRLFHQSGRGSLKTLGFISPAAVLRLISG